MIGLVLALAGFVTYDVDDVTPRYSPSTHLVRSTLNALADLSITSPTKPTSWLQQFIRSPLSTPHSTRYCLNRPFRTDPVL